MISHTGELPALTWAADPDRRRARGVAIVATAMIVVMTGWTAVRFAQRSILATLPAANAQGVIASVGRRPSHAGLYHAEVVAASPYVAGAKQSWTVRLTRRGHRRVSGARLAVRSWAPATGDVSPVPPSVRYVGDGRYRIDDVYFPAPGWWNVALVIDARTGVDSVAFNVMVPAATPSGSEQAHRPTPQD